MNKPPDYRSTLNLPQTSFPMRADLAKREPDRVAWWAENNIYEKRLARNSSGPMWTLHDGPPYANGDLHMGHFLNRVLKDVFVKLHLLQGYRSTFIPGWDMHGLPIEMETLKHLKLDFRKVDPIELRAKCAERATHWLGIQRDTILRMGVLGRYDKPYRSLDPQYEGIIVDALAELVQEKQIYKGLRPTLWCTHDETALAEAEIEYKDRVSTSVYVRFSARGKARADLLTRLLLRDVPAAEAVSFVIWTTTPWTLPANVAIAIDPAAQYGVFRARIERPGAAPLDELLIVAQALGPSFAALYAEGARLTAPDAVVGFEELTSVAGDALIGAQMRHPLLERESLVVGADYIELETGTGAVHTAPGHGVDDFRTAQRFGLPTIMPIDDQGRFTAAEGGPYAGLHVNDATPKIVEDLRACGALVWAADYRHSYPHCWRCKNPVIYRATAQWFISLDANRLRLRTLDQLNHVVWTPAWGEGRMTQMIENHPEWCISRQRTWGTPIPALRCVNCQRSILDAEVARKAANRFRAVGANSWWTDDVGEFLPRNFHCEDCRGTQFEKEFAIVDIWFESGVSYRAVLGHDGLAWPADLYLEGSDQYRGWFRSSLVTSVATRGVPPYKRVVSTGWVVDAQGRAMHKSAGNYIGARDAMQKYGADVLRLWVASVEFTADVRLGDNLLDNVANVYRNLRNRLRFLLSATAGLTAESVLEDDELEPLDRLALAALDEVTMRVLGSYRAFNLHDVYLALLAFDAEDLSRFYLDALKDRLYSSGSDARRRRSAQTACLLILQRILSLLAPILSFTAEEAWQHLAPDLREGAPSVFDIELNLPAPHDEEDVRVWVLLKQMRATVSANDVARDFELRAVVRAGSDYQTLRKLGDNLREALIVSQLELIEDTTRDETLIELYVAEGEKCARCWKILPGSNDAELPGLCAPCTDIVRSSGVAV